jgi:hypothetical protein
MFLWSAWAVDWGLYELVDFNGTDRRIYIHPLISSINVREDIYSAWKRWCALRDNSKYTPAMRAIGGDPLGGGLYSGDMYFLMNSWQIVIDHNVSFQGNLYHDTNGLSPFIIQAGGGVTSTVSSLAYGYSTTGVEAPTAVEVAQAVFNKALSDPINPNTYGSYIQSIPLVAPPIDVDLTPVTNQLNIMEDKLDDININIHRLLDIQEGNWKILDYQMVFYTRTGQELLRYNLFDKEGTLSDVEVFSREKV